MARYLRGTVGTCTSSVLTYLFVADLLGDMTTTCRPQYNEAYAAGASEERGADTFQSALLIVSFP